MLKCNSILENINAIHTCTCTCLVTSGDGTHYSTTCCTSLCIEVMIFFYLVCAVGLDAAGKTTILYKLKLGEIVTTIPTIGKRY